MRPEKKYGKAATISRAAFCSAGKEGGELQVLFRADAPRSLYIRTFATGQCPGVCHADGMEAMEADIYICQLINSLPGEVRYGANKDRTK